VQALQHYGLQPVQLQPLHPQPYRLASVYEIETEPNNLPAVLDEFSVLARRAAKAEGLLQRDVAHVFELTRPTLSSPRSYHPAAPLHVAFVMGNCVEGKDDEFDSWYDNIHSVEALETPGFVGMRLGALNPLQADPRDYQAANRMVMFMIRTYDLWATIQEFIARASGTSKSGVKWSPRAAAAGFISPRRTTHVFSPYTPRLEAVVAEFPREVEGLVHG
jgi:hypothetical protein